VEKVSISDVRILGRNCRVKHLRVYNIERSESDDFPIFLINICVEHIFSILEQFGKKRKAEMLLNSKARLLVLFQKRKARAHVLLCHGAETLLMRALDIRKFVMLLKVTLRNSMGLAAEIAFPEFNWIEKTVEVLGNQHGRNRWLCLTCCERGREYSGVNPLFI